MKKKKQLFAIVVCLFAIVSVLLAARTQQKTPQLQAKRILRNTGLKGGLIVHIGCGDGKLTAALWANESPASPLRDALRAYIVQGLDTDTANIVKARRYIKSLGIYGKVTAETFDGQHLPYTDNLVNLLVVSSRYHLLEDEMLRVLAPGGTAYLDKGSDWEKIVKSRPKNIDEWTHYLHGPGNNAVAHDTVVGPPRHMQWLGEPRWTRYHHTLNSISAVVTAGGRIFYILDEATAANMDVPGKWTIVARDAFNGVGLWKKQMPGWAWHRIKFRSGPPQVTRLLVASQDRLYAPLGLNAPISVMDTATGKTLKTYENTGGAEEIVLVDSILLTLKGSPVAEQAVGHAAFSNKFRSPNSKSIIALNAESGEKLWEWSNPQANPSPETLGSDGSKVYFQVNEGVMCLDLKSGEELWTFGQLVPARQDQARKPKQVKSQGHGKYTLVVADGVVLCKLSGKLTALSSEDGSKLWECKAGSGFRSPLDIFVIDGLVWQGLHASGSVASAPVYDFDKGLDLHTGQVKKDNSILVDLQTVGHHHRCYREKATDRYIITGKRGIEMMDLLGDEHCRNNWVRGTCQYGVLPANGLIYAPSHACGCYMESKLWGFWALAAKRQKTEDRRQKTERLEKGPAYGELKTQNLKLKTSDEWPMYRHDLRRSGIAGTIVPAKLEQAWEMNIGGKLTQPVVAKGKVLLSAVDENTVYALDEKTGKVIWEYVAGGRVDSPPVIYKAMALFGSADGWVYCLRLSDGKLIWRFLAAPQDLKTVAFDQAESLWPVHGSVLVLNGVAYCSAGRSTWLDGGIYFYGLDPVTGIVICKSRFESTHPKSKQGAEQAKPEHVKKISQNTTDYKTYLAPDLSDSFSMAGGSITDILVSDGKNVFMHQVKFNAKLEKQQKMSRHLFSTSGMLDGSENHRSHWVLGTGDFSRIPVAYSWIVNNPSRWSPAIAVPFGLMMVYDDNAIWAVQRQGSFGLYRLLETDNKPFSDDDESLPDFRAIPKDQVNPSKWNTSLSVRPRAMLKSGSNLFMAVMPTDILDDNPYAAYEGRKGGMLWIASAEDGSKLSEYKLVSPVVWDGMAAANGRLYLSMENGRVACFAGK